MTGTTTGQTSLLTATDSDDAENFLTVSLTTDLQTLANLFDSSTGHDHTGSGKGKPIGSAGIAASVTLTSPTLTSVTISSGGLAVSGGSINVTAGSAQVSGNFLALGGSSSLAPPVGIGPTNGSLATPLAQSGDLNFFNARKIAWRNSGNSGDNTLTIDGADRLNVSVNPANVLTAVGGAGGASAMPTPQEYMFVTVNGNARRIALFN